MEIKNLKLAAGRILRAIKNKEKIIIYGDADLDGVTSVIILKETIKNLGGRVESVHFSNRETEGYGVSEKGLKSLREFSPALLISVDCGIGNFKEMDLAKEWGFSTIIIDHHQVLDKLPRADIIIDPKQEGDQYPFKELAAVGITFLLSKVILGEKMSEAMRRNFLELVAIATIADMMPQDGDNKIFIEEGLESIESSFRPGLRAFFEIDFFKSDKLKESISKIISILNVRDLDKGLPLSFRILTSLTLDEAKEMIERLIRKNEDRKENIEKIIQEVKKRISGSEEPIIFEGDEEWDSILISSAASRLSREYQKPIFLFKKLKKESLGTVRTPSRIDAVLLMKKCRVYPMIFGGHARAAGFRIKNDNLEKFKKCLIKKLSN